MNIAFPALLILLLILPGMIFRYGYARGSWGWTSPISFRTVSDELAYSAIFAVGLHFLWLVLGALLGYQADLAALLALLTGNFGPQGQYYEGAVRSVSDHSIALATYFISLFLAAAIGGRSAHWFIRWSGLDLRTQIFRFKNEWYYLLTGEILSFKEVSIAPREIDGVYLSAVVDHGRESYLYRGIVEDWSFDRDGQLDTIRLRFTHRRLLSADRPAPAQTETGSYVPPDERYYEVRGDLFVLRYSQIKTLNLDYFSLSEVRDGEAIEDGAGRSDSKV